MTLSPTTEAIRVKYGFLGQVVDLALYVTKVLGSKPLPGGLSTNPQLTFVTFAPVSVHSPHISPF
jgi:hypothetical protein